jgi:hypothetical protein
LGGIVVSALLVSVIFPLPNTLTTAIRDGDRQRVLLAVFLLVASGVGLQFAAAGRLLPRAALALAGVIILLSYGSLMVGAWLPPWVGADSGFWLRSLGPFPFVGSGVLLGGALAKRGEMH